ncbi:protein kinase [Phytophthora infestans T30-4]|uniref:Protein kinase n=1 Tax=Phytophthora infestans (strain T30-4) TaxID=403677 RepID=D0P2Z2_PHYIT|nr:protein kinase [Phytophthora infestans T30-4]EEY58518.1 protein kinase [Phytophthora infestans T30-4]|eukprot:XP_002895330.1 protein kinase [Phytophthora infestans T30-4]
MADIAVSAEAFEEAGCDAVTCTASNGDNVEMYSSCSQGPAQMLAASKCVVEMFDSTESSNATLWSTSGNSSTVPDIRVAKSTGTAECGCGYTIYSIQTATSNEQATATGVCPAGEWSGSLVIPCYGSDSIPESIAARVTPPKGTDWVTRWILEHGGPRRTTESFAPSQGSASATTESGRKNGGGFSLWWLLLILLIIALLIVATIVACRHCHRLSRFHTPLDNTTYIFVGGRMWAVEDESRSRRAGYWLRFANWCRKTFNFFE